MTDWVLISKNTVWDTARADELFGDSQPVTQELRDKLQANASKLLKNVHVEVYNMIHIKEILGFLMQRNLLTNGELHQLNRDDFDHNQKTLQLAGYIFNKPRSPIKRFYLALLDSYSRPGLEGHYQLARKIRENSLNVLGINAEDILAKEQDMNVIMQKIRAVSIPLHPSMAQQLATLLGIPTYDPETAPSEVYSVCQHWFSTATDPGLSTLIRALLCTQGLGRLVTTLLPICYSNPPSVCKFLAKYSSKWSRVATFLGYDKTLIESLISRNSCSTEEQIRYFQRVWRVPDCGENLEDILCDLADKTGLNSNTGQLIVPEQAIVAEEPVEPKVEAQVTKMYVEDMEPQLWKVRLSKRKVMMAEFGTGAVCTSVAFDTEEENEVEDTTCIPDGSISRELLEACLQKDWDLANPLIDPANRGAMKSKDEKCRTPLLLCCLEKQVELVKKLLENGADVRARDEAGNCCLHYSTVLNDVELLHMLLDGFARRGVCVDFRSKNGTTPLLIACFIGDGCAGAVELLLNAGANPNGVDQALYRPLTVACSGGHTKIVNLLLDHSANIDIQDKEGRTPLICACLRYHFTVAKLLVENGADISITDKTNTSALFACTANDSCEMSKLLIERGANVNIIRFRGDPSTGHVEETPLALACGTGNLRMVKLLVENGADINQLCSGTVPPVGFAIILNQLHIVEYLVNHQKFSSDIYDLARPITIGVQGQYWHCVQYILERFFATAETALEVAYEKRFTQLSENIENYLSIISGEDYASLLRIQTSSEIDALKQEEQGKNFASRHAGEECLERFSQICINAAQESCNFRVLAEQATTAGLQDVANFYMECYHYTQDPVEFKTNFLIGEISALRLLVQKKIIDYDDFVSHALRYYQDELGEFLNNLVITFHEVNGADYLPFDDKACLQQVFNGAFIPTVTRGPRKDSANFLQPQQPQTISDSQNNLTVPVVCQESNWQFDPYQSSLGGVPFSQYDNRPSATSASASAQVSTSASVLTSASKPVLKSTSAPAPSPTSSPIVDSAKRGARRMKGVAGTSTLATDFTTDYNRKENSCVDEMHVSSEAKHDAVDSTTRSGSTLASEAQNLGTETTQEKVPPQTQSHEANPSQASRPPTVKRLADTPPNSQEHRSAVPFPEGNSRAAPLPHFSKLPSHQESVDSLTAPSKKLLASFQETIQDEQDLKSFLRSLDITLHNKLRHGEIEVDVKVSSNSETSRT